MVASGVISASACENAYTHVEGVASGLKRILCITLYTLYPVHTDRKSLGLSLEASATDTGRHAHSSTRRVGPLPPPLQEAVKVANYRETMSF